MWKIVRLPGGPAKPHVHESLETPVASARLLLLQSPVLQLESPDVSRTDTHEGPAVHVRHLRQTVHSDRKSECPSENSRGAAAVWMSSVWSEVCQQTVCEEAWGYETSVQCWNGIRYSSYLMWLAWSQTQIARTICRLTSWTAGPQTV